MHVNFYVKDLCRHIYMQCGHKPDCSYGISLILRHTVCYRDVLKRPVDATHSRRHKRGTNSCWSKGDKRSLKDTLEHSGFADIQVEKLNHNFYRVLFYYFKHTTLPYNNLLNKLKTTYQSFPIISGYVVSISSVLRI